MQMTTKEIASSNMTIIRQATAKSLISTPLSGQRCGGGSVPLITTTSIYFCNVYTSGGNNNHNAYYSAALLPGFAT